jgi:hypothetical protein
MAVFVRDRAGRTKNHVVDWSLPELSLLIDRGLLGQQFLPADDIGRVTLRHTVHWRPKGMMQPALSRCLTNLNITDLQLRQSNDRLWHIAAFAAPQ